jgi:hypothetical protein
MKKILAILSVSLAFAAPAALAQAPAAAPAAAAAPADPAARAAAKEMLDAMNYRSIVQVMFAQMQQSMPDMMTQSATAAINANTKLDAKQKKQALAKMESELPKAAAMMAGIFSDPTLIDELLSETADLYGRHYTVDELKQIGAFYKTPVGAKMLATMPQVMNEAMQLGQRVVMPRIGPMIEKLAQTK